jgi:hypothetical protein
VGLGSFDVAEVFEEDVGHLHRHSAEVGNEVRACLVTCQATL